MLARSGDASFGKFHAVINAHSVEQERIDAMTTKAAELVNQAAVLIREGMRKGQVEYILATILDDFSEIEEIYQAAMRKVPANQRRGAVQPGGTLASIAEEKEESSFYDDEYLKVAIDFAKSLIHQQRETIMHIVFKLRTAFGFSLRDAEYIWKRARKQTQHVTVKKESKKRIEGLKLAKQLFCRLESNDDLFPEQSLLQAIYNCLRIALKNDVQNTEFVFNLVNPNLYGELLIMSDFENEYQTYHSSSLNHDHDDGNNNIDEMREMMILVAPDKIDNVELQIDLANAMIDLAQIDTDMRESIELIKAQESHDFAPDPFGVIDHFSEIRNEFEKRKREQKQLEFILK